MTFIGKLFLMINLAVSVLLAVSAFGLYAAGIDWSDQAAQGGKPAGKLLALRKDVDATLAELPLAEGSWKAERAQLLTLEERRRADRAWYDAELAKVTAGKGPLQVADTAAAPDPAGHPRMVPADDGAGRPLMTRQVYDDRLKEYQEENRKSRDDLARKVKEDEDLTRRLTGGKEGDPEPRARGLRRQLVEERAKRQGIIDEAGITESLQVNVAVDSELVLKRLEALRERIRELVAYLKRKHKVDESAGPR